MLCLAERVSRPAMCGLFYAHPNVCGMGLFELQRKQTMTAVIKLGNKPKTFKPFPVKFTMPDGEEGAINTTFKYRTRKEYGAFLNDLYHSADTEKPAEGEKIDLKRCSPRVAKRQ